DGSLEEDLLNNVAKSAWQDIADAAEMYNEPGRFTTFLAYEYTSATVERGNLHRNVIFRDNQAAPAIPFSRYHSRNPEDLWSWMDGLRAKGIESLAIPHNSNGSNGAMFQRTDWAGNAFTEEYSRTRMRNEPLVEITQIKGTSDTNPRHSPNDEWADFEIMPFRVGTTLPSKEDGSYVREAYLNGLSLAADGLGNPYKFGLVAASDTHVAATSDDEESYFSKAGLLDGDAVARGSIPAPKAVALAVGALLPDSLQEIDGETYMSTSSFETWGASGIAGVWAEENTRDSIYAAFRRKETFATTGPRIKLRFFASYDFNDELLADENRVETAYQQGVTMGATLEAKQRIDEMVLTTKAEVSDELNRSRAEMKSLSERVAAGVDTVQRTDIRSPVRGTIKELKRNTVGGVIRPGEDIVEIVPLDDTLLVEAKIRPSDRAFLRSGQKATIKVTAYDFSIYGGLEGKLERISASTIKDEEGESFYRVYLRTEDNKIVSKGKELEIIPGMTANVEILTGKKTVMDYLLKPILKARDSALREK
ncbi:HlyD family type I secretion periplasmic adaptor subunit, partial [uncultured Kiloniella sp.]|uniref:HlyD family type I secretion periplasmic adaptor subunit n=1 Tax=uncultured Kiloniella sp. TaxID=1133091 RepID=UPI00260EBB47